jgi:hypothetical protein
VFAKLPTYGIVGREAQEMSEGREAPLRPVRRSPVHLARAVGCLDQHPILDVARANESALFVRVVAVQDRLECDAGFLLRLRAGATPITSASAARTRPYARSVTLCLFERLTSSCYWRR